MPTEGHLHLSHGRDCHRTEVPVTWVPPQPHLPPPVTLGKFFTTLQASLFSAAKVTGPHLGGGGEGGHEDHRVRPEEMVSEWEALFALFPLLTCLALNHLSVTLSPRPLLGCAHGIGFFLLTSILLSRTPLLALPDTPQPTPLVLGERASLTPPACLSADTSQRWSSAVGVCAKVASCVRCPLY